MLDILGFHIDQFQWIIHKSLIIITHYIAKCSQTIFCSLWILFNFRSIITISNKNKKMTSWFLFCMSYLDPFHRYRFFQDLSQKNKIIATAFLLIFDHDYISIFCFIHYASQLHNIYYFCRFFMGIMFFSVLNNSNNVRSQMWHLLHF